MNKAILILILLGAGVAILSAFVFFFLFFTTETTPPTSGSVGVSLNAPLNLHVDDILETENSFYREFSEPLSFKQYAILFKQTQETVSFQPLYPKTLPVGYGLIQILAWNKESEAITALFGTKDGELFTLKITDSLNPNILGEQKQKYQLVNGENATLWEFQEMQGLSYLLLFATQKVQGKTFFYYLGTEDLSPQELIDIANSSL